MMLDVDDVISFSAVIYEVGQNRCVDVPPEAVFGRGVSTVPVVLTVAGRSVPTNLLSRGDSQFRVFVNTDLRNAAGADTGDTIDVEIRIDISNREPDIPAMLAAALQATEWGMTVFNGLTVNQRREIVRFINDAKRNETRAKRVARAIEVLDEMNQKTK